MRITSPNEARAVSRYVRVSPYKARQVMQGLRGMPVAVAQRHLAFIVKNAAEPVLKTLNSAVANAEHNLDLDAEDLVVLEAKVDEGPTLKRFQPRAMGRAYRIRKRTAHITITVGIPAPAPVDKAPAAKAPAAKGTDSPAEES